MSAWLKHWMFTLTDLKAIWKQIRRNSDANDRKNNNNNNDITLQRNIINIQRPPHHHRRPHYDTGSNCSGDDCPMPHRLIAWRHLRITHVTVIVNAVDAGFVASHLRGNQMCKFNSIKSQMGREKEKNQTIVLLLGSREWHAALPHCNIVLLLRLGMLCRCVRLKKAELKFTDFCSWIERTYENELLVLLWLLPLLVRLYCFSLNSSGNEMFNDDLNVCSNATIYFTHTTDWLTEVA